jgi:hypothetical protein
VIFLVVASYIILATINAQADGFLVNDQGSKFLQVQALVQSGWRDAAIEYPGRVFDSAGDFSPLKQAIFFRRGAEFVSIYLTPYLLLVSTLYALFGDLGLYIVSSAAGAVVICLLVVLGRLTITRNGVPLAMIATGFASPVFFYATEFWEHAAASSLAIAGLCLFLSDRRLGWFASGLCWGLGAACRPEMLMFGLAVVIAVAVVGAERRADRFVYALLSMGMVLLPVMMYYRLAFGTCLGPQFAANSPRDASLVNLLQSWWRAWPVRVQMLLAGGIQSSGLVLGLVLIIVLKYALRRWSSVVMSVACVWTIGISALALASVVHGKYPDDVLTCFPLAAFAIVAWLTPRDDTGACSTVRLWAYIVGLYMLLALLIVPNAGGRQWGPRYLLPVFPLLALLAVCAFQRIMGSASSGLRRLGLVAFAIPMAVGVGVQVIGLLMSVGRVGNTALVQAVRAAPGEIIVAEKNYISTLAAKTFDEKLWFTVSDLSRLDAFLEGLRMSEETPVVFIVEVESEPRISARLLEEGCNLTDQVSIGQARPPLLMLYATCGSSERVFGRNVYE